MNRRGFLKYIGICIAALPAIAKTEKITGTFIPTITDGSSGKGVYTRKGNVVTFHVTITTDYLDNLASLHGIQRKITLPYHPGGGSDAELKKRILAKIKGQVPKPPRRVYT